MLLRQRGLSGNATFEPRAGCSAQAGELAGRPSGAWARVQVQWGRGGWAGRRRGQREEREPGPITGLGLGGRVALELPGGR